MGHLTTYTLEDVPQLVDNGRYNDALRTLYEANHSLSYELFPRRNNNSVTPNASADIGLSEEQINRLQDYVRQMRTSSSWMLLAAILFSGLPLILVVSGLMSLYQLLTIPMLPVNSEIILSCCHGIIILPIAIGSLVFCGLVYKVLKSENLGLW